MIDFRIKRYEYFNERGKVTNEYYYIQQRKKFLWKYRWSDVKHEECGYGDCCKTRTKFKTLDEAQQFVENVLCPKLPIDCHKKTVVDIITCKTIKNSKN